MNSYPAELIGFFGSSAKISITSETGETITITQDERHSFTVSGGIVIRCSPWAITVQYNPDKKLTDN
jgi:hypothetical protein